MNLTLNGRPASFIHEMIIIFKIKIVSYLNQKKILLKIGY